MSTTTQAAVGPDSITRLVNTLLHVKRYEDARHLLAMAVAADVITNDDALVEFYPLVRPSGDREFEIVKDALRDGRLGVQTR